MRHCFTIAAFILSDFYTAVNLFCLMAQLASLPSPHPYKVENNNIPNGASRPRACGLGEQTCCCLRLFSVAAEHEKPHINSRIAMQCVAYMAMHGDLPEK